jgi:hypothetical protein
MFSRRCEKFTRGRSRRRSHASKCGLVPTSLNGTVTAYGGRRRTHPQIRLRVWRGSCLAPAACFATGRADRHTDPRAAGCRLHSPARPEPPDPLFFAAFNDPGYVKIVWSLRADPLGSDRSIFRTETRAIATDRDARVRFRRYWAFASPGIWLIRRASLGPLKREAERQATAS